MKIFVDVGHPAHVHYLKNTIRILQSKGHSFIITARDKEVTFGLLNSLGLDFYNRGKGASGLLSNFMYLIKTNWQLLRIAKKHQPDIFFSPASAYMAQVSKLMNKPYIAFEDTEHASLNQKLYIPFADVILTPECFKKSLGKKQIRFKSYLELSYLYPTYFKPNQDIKKELGIIGKKKLALVRFVAWEAFHDRDEVGLTMEFKINLIKELSKYCRVIISSEKELPDQLKEFEFKFPPEKLHELLQICDLYIGEGATTASEAAILGTPAVYINNLAVGYCTEQEDLYQMVYNFRNTDGLMQKIMELIQNDRLKEEAKIRSSKLISDHIDLTAFFVWFIENYPNSRDIIKANTEYQFNFKLK
jgi:predicted glycosyltransferase